MREPLFVMKYTDFDIQNAEAIGNIPDSCGAVTVGCSDVAGIVEAVIQSSETLRAEHDALRGTVEALEADQLKVSEASDEARLLSERATARLNEGTDLIQSSLGKINSLLELVDALGQHVTSFSAAMEQVRRSAQDIDDIAETTNILALNATIEAMRAGDAGRTFAVVASEVKSLANDTRKATEEIAQTVDALGSEAGEVIGRIEAGAIASSEAKSSVSRIENTIENVGALVEEVDKQNDVIARSTTTISDHVNSVQDVLSSYDNAARTNEARLLGAHERMTDLEQTANEMFDSMVQSGLSHQDGLIVEKCIEFKSELEKITQAAIASSEVTMAQLFDTDYQPVIGSNPERYTSSLTHWANQVWRSFLDKAVAEDPHIVASVCSDQNGFLPTHLSSFSKEPTGDLAHDTAFCRNGRINFTALDKRAKKSTKPYLMAVYRHEGDGKTYQLMRNIYVPMHFGGKRWGDFEIAYTLD